MRSVVDLRAGECLRRGMGLGGAHGRGAGAGPQRGVNFRIFRAPQPCCASQRSPALPSAHPCRAIGASLPSRRRRGVEGGVFVGSDSVGVVDSCSGRGVGAAWGLAADRVHGVHGRLFGFERTKLGPLQWFPALFWDKGHCGVIDKGGRSAAIHPEEPPAPTPRTKPRAPPIGRGNFQDLPTNQKKPPDLSPANEGAPAPTPTKNPPPTPPIPQPPAFTSKAAGWNIMTGFPSA